MTEGRFTSALLHDLRRHPALAGCIVWKLSDRWTGGIPDFVIVKNSRTYWFEVKVQGNGLSGLQKATMGNPHMGRCGFIILARHNGSVEISGMPYCQTVEASRQAAVKFIAESICV